MPLTFSPPPGIHEYCNPGKQLKRVLAFLSCVFAPPVYFQLRLLTGNKGKINCAFNCPVTGPGDLGICEATADIRSGLESNVEFDKGIKDPSVISRFRENINLKKIFGETNHYKTNHEKIYTDY